MIFINSKMVFFGRILGGIRKVGRFIGNVAGSVGRVAGGLSKIPVIGGIASTVARGANLVNRVANGAANIADKVGGFVDRNRETIQKVQDAGRAIHQSGIPDRLTNGGFSRVVDRARDFAHQAERRFDQAVDRGRDMYDRARGYGYTAANVINRETNGRFGNFVAGIRPGRMVGGRESNWRPPANYETRRGNLTVMPRPTYHGY